MKRHRAVLGAYADEVIARREGRRPRRRRARRADRRAPVGEGADADAAPRSRARAVPCRQRDDRGRAVVGTRARRRITRRVGQACATIPSRYTLPFLTESLRLSPRSGASRGPRTRAGVTLTAGGVDNPGATRPGRDRVPARHQSRPEDRGTTRCASIRRATTTRRQGAQRVRCSRSGSDHAGLHRPAPRDGRADRGAARARPPGRRRHRRPAAEDATVRAPRPRRPSRPLHAPACDERTRAFVAFSRACVPLVCRLLRI